MNSRDAIRLSIDAGSMVSLGYLDDLSDQELLHRPCAGCNHINWQVGHLIAAENTLINNVVPGAMPALPAGFAEKYTAQTAGSDEPRSFASKAELLKIFKEQRDATLASLAKQTEADLDKPSGVEWAPTVGAIFSMQGSHWLMHAGQWAVVRRQLGRKPLF
jgi:hypothetical protein